MEMHTPQSLKVVHGIAPATHTGSRSSSWALVRRFLAAVAAAIARHHERSRSREWLSGLDDRMLADLGIRRHDIDRTLAYGRRRFHHH